MGDKPVEPPAAEPWEAAEAWEPWVMSVWYLEGLERQQERPPRRWLRRTPLAGRGPEPVGRSIAGFEAAVSAVLQIDDQAALRDWESRGPRVSEIGAAVNAIGEAAVAHRPDIRAAIDALWAEQHETYMRSTHVETVVCSGSRRILEVVRRRHEREREITAELEQRREASASLSEHGTASRAWRDQWGLITETTVARINSQTRRILDLTDETKSISVAKWLSLQCESPDHGSGRG